MKIYQISPFVEQYKQLADDEPENMSKARFKELSFEGDSKTSYWRPITLRWIVGEDLEGPDRDIYDNDTTMPDMAHWYPGCIVLSPKATNILRPVFKNEAEFLPVAVGSEDWTIFNIINMQNAVKDVIEADYVERWFDTITFDEAKMTNAKIFRVPHKPNRMYTSDVPGSFKVIVESHGLTGFLFDER